MSQDRNKGRGALAARPGYEVGYGKPPVATRFRKGQSGNPTGRPKGSKNKLPALNEERMKAMILEEAYRTIPVRDGERTVNVPIARAVLRSLAVSAAKGQYRAQRLFAELLSAVETSNKQLHDDWVKTAIDYKVGWEEELDRRRALGITHLADPLPHPDHIRIDLNAGTARIVGPKTREEKAAWDWCISVADDLETEIRELPAMIEAETDPAVRRLMEEDLARDRKLVRFIRRAEKGEL
jgi:hypothetical protein